MLNISVTENWNKSISFETDAEVSPHRVTIMYNPHEIFHAKFPGSSGFRACHISIRSVYA